MNWWRSDNSNMPQIFQSVNRRFLAAGLFESCSIGSNYMGGRDTCHRIPQKWWRLMSHNDTCCQMWRGMSNYEIWIKKCLKCSMVDITEQKIEKNAYEALKHIGSFLNDLSSLLCLLLEAECDEFRLFTFTLRQKVAASNSWTCMQKVSAFVCPLIDMLVSFNDSNLFIKAVTTLQ